MLLIGREWMILLNSLTRSKGLYMNKLRGSDICEGV
jgi:hypothetical protein